MDDSVRVTGDRDRLLQALDNLLSNAVKFTPSGGRVTLGATADEHDVCFVVRDTGGNDDRRAVEPLYAILAGAT